MAEQVGGLQVRGAFYQNNMDEIYVPYLVKWYTQHFYRKYTNYQIRMCSQIPNTSDLLKQFGLQVKETKAISIKLVLHILQQNVKVKKAMAYTRT